jgi:hypothetical protein
VRRVREGGAQRQHNDSLTSARVHSPAELLWGSRRTDKGARCVTLRVAAERPHDVPGLSASCLHTRHPKVFSPPLLDAQTSLLERRRALLIQSREVLPRRSLVGQLLVGVTPDLDQQVCGRRCLDWGVLVSRRVSGMRGRTRSPNDSPGFCADILVLVHIHVRHLLPDLASRRTWRSSLRLRTRTQIRDSESSRRTSGSDNAPDWRRGTLKDTRAEVEKARTERDDEARRAANMVVGVGLCIA